MQKDNGLIRRFFAAGKPRCQCHHPTAPSQHKIHTTSTRIIGNFHRPAKDSDAGDIHPHDTFNAEYIQVRVYSSVACIYITK